MAHPLLTQSRESTSKNIVQASWDSRCPSCFCLGPAVLLQVSVERQAEETPDFRRRQSQFTDTADYRRAGRNTWQEESGVYLSPGSRSGVHTRPTNPFLP